MADNSSNVTDAAGGGGVWHTQYFELVVGVSFGFVLLLFLLLYCLAATICACTCCTKCGRRRRGGATGRSESALGLIGKQVASPVDPIFLEMGVVGGLLQGENSVHNPAFVTGVAKERQIEFPRTSICILRELGETTFGPLCLGEATGLDENELSTTVLIKTLKLGSTAAAQEEFNNELRWAVDFKHPNILPLLAVCTRDQPKYLIYDYLEYGTLKHFLQSTSSALGAFDDALTELTADDSLSSAQCHPVLELDVLTKFALQIASAMQYLGEKGFVHQDLATRNVHVGKSMEAKIANFGFSRDVRSSDYYHMKDLKDKLLPVRWLAPETLKEGIYSPETDMWAYGVVLWEIFSCGQTPNKALSNPEVIQRILKAKPLPKPTHCPDIVYRIMLACWRREPQLRPNFKEVNMQLEKFEMMSPRPRGRGWSWRKRMKMQRQSSRTSRLPKTPEQTTREDTDAQL